MKSTLFSQSIEIIRKYQGESGGYIASPSFKPYQYCWFRVGSFIAYAMNMAGQVESAADFFGWSANTLIRHHAMLAACVQ